MSEEINNENIDNEKSNDSVDNDLSVQLAEMQKQLEAVKNKNNELISEKRKVQARIEEEKQEKERMALERAKKNGDYEQLLKSSEMKRKEIEEKYNNLQNKLNKESINTASMKLAAELADGVNAELLSEFISKRIKPTDEGLKVLDKDGQLTVSTLDDLKREFESSDRFKSLLRGNKSNGGGAVGDGGSASGIKEIKRAEFENKTPAEKMAFVKNGGKIID